MIVINIEQDSSQEEIERDPSLLEQSACIWVRYLLGKTGVDDCAR